VFVSSGSPVVYSVGNIRLVEEATVTVINNVMLCCRYRSS